jgi:hypothetical protein
MPVMLSVYCKRSVAAVTSEDLLATLRSADVAMIAESRHLWLGLIDDVLTHLQIVRSQSEKSVRWELRYWPGIEPQCVIRCAALLSGARDPHLDQLRTIHHPGVDRIRRHLAESLEWVTFDFPQDRHAVTTALLASEAARWFAELGDAVIARADNSWWDLDQLGAYRRILP